MPTSVATSPCRILSRGAAVGLAATAVDLALLTLFLHAAHLPLRAASPLALAAGVTVQFVGSRAVTLRARGGRWWPQVMGFAAVEAISFMANVALTELASSASHLSPALVRVPVTSLVDFAVSLPLWSWVFRPTGEPT
jgi:putative flippase GtrA